MTGLDQKYRVRTVRDRDELSKTSLETSLEGDKGSMLGTNDIAHMNGIRSNASPVAIFVPVFFGRKKKQSKISAEMSRKRVFII